nr:CRISPR-associated protein Cas4 [Sulfolobus islandicus]
MREMIIEELFKEKISEAKQHQRNEGEVYVTDLVRCPLKAKYELLYPELKDAEAYTPSFILGDLVHKGLEEFLKEKFNAELEVEGAKQLQIDGKTITLKGRADALTNDYVIEIKSSRADRGLPHEHHILQLRLYLWLFNKSKGVLVYITPDRITEYEINNPPDEAEVLELVEDFMKAKNAPKFKWECGYCTFSVLCPRRMVPNDNK